MTRDRLMQTVKIVLTLAIVVFSVYFSFWNIDLSELGRSFSAANYWLMLTLVPVVLVSHWVRAHRWRVMLETVHPGVRLGDLFGGVMVGYFMNNLIPRSGELARPWYTAQRASTPFGSLLGTIVTERFIDSIALLLIVLGVLFFDARLFEGFEEYGITSSAVRGMLLPVIILGIAFVFIAPSRLGTSIARVVARPLPARFSTRALDLFAELQRGFGAVRTPRQVLLVVIETVLIYTLYMLPLYIMLFAFPSAAHTDPTLWDATKILAITAMAFAVAPTPGAFGIFHVTARIAVVRLVGFTDADALAYATLSHFGSYIVVMLVGGWYLVRGGLSMKDLLRARREPV